MYHRWMLFLVVLVSTFTSGCKSSNSLDYRPWDADDYGFDQLWREGHGFNNPNVDRIRRGQPPEDF